MTKKEKELIDKLDIQEISFDLLLQQYPKGILDNENHIRDEVKNAIATKNRLEIEYAISLVFLSRMNEKLIDIYNELVLVKEHRNHQELVWKIQQLKDPSSVPFLQKALATGFDYLKYTCSDSDAIAKWFSHALFQIGTPEAIQVLKDFSLSEDEGISKEMKYRLAKVK